MSDVIIAGRGKCCDPFSALKEEIDMAVTIAMNARNIAEEALASTGAGASDNNPLALADTASPGSAMEWSRSDHVHPNTGLLEPDDVTAGDNIEVTDNGDGTVTIALKADQVRVGNTILTGNVTITGNITQNGSAYETHAEQVFTTDDYIIMRDSATGALGSGDYSGFQVKLYDGTNDGRLVIDNTGTARVGDVGYEQPLLTREESDDLTDGAILKWDAANMKAIDEGTVGTDTKPIKIVNGVATAITNDLVTVNTAQFVTGAKYLTTALHGQIPDVNRFDIRFDACNPNSSYVARLVLMSNNDGSIAVALEKWTKTTDAQGNIIAGSFITGTTLGNIS